MSIPRSASRSSTLRSDSGYLTYIITTSRITSGELLKYRNGLLMTLSYHGERRPPKIALTMPRPQRTKLQAAIAARATSGRFRSAALARVAAYSP